MEEKQENLEKERKQLRYRLRDSKEYREQYATSALVEGVSRQVAALRRQRGLKQKDLADLTGTRQPRISSIEAPRYGESVPNWELDTLNRMAQALGCRLKISFETYGSLVTELASLTPDSLRRPDVESDPILNPLPETMPQPDADAPQRTRWMQERMIPWLYDDSGLGSDTLKRWLQGYGLPPVGHDESPAQWLLRGIPAGVSRSVRDRLERRLAERVAFLLEEQPDLYPSVEDRPEEFLIALYSLCAGFQQPAFLARPLWKAYKRLNQSRLNREVRNALQAALISNQDSDREEDDKALNEIWKPMVETGKHGWLSGGELTGYRGMAARRIHGKPDYPPILEALETLSHRWSGTPEDELAFDQMIESFPDRRVLLRAVWNGAISLSNWAANRLPKRPHPEPATLPFPAESGIAADASQGLEVAKGDVVCRVMFGFDGRAQLSINTPTHVFWEGELDDLRGTPKKRSVVCNSVATELGNLLENPELTLPNETRIIREAYWVCATLPA